MDEIVVACQKAQLANPAYAGVNCESIFVRGRIRDMGYPELSMNYWIWACRGGRNGSDISFCEEAVELEKKLGAMLKSSMKLDTWGT